MLELKEAKRESEEELNKNLIKNSDVFIPTAKKTMLHLWHSIYTLRQNTSVQKLGKPQIKKRMQVIIIFL